MLENAFFFSILLLGRMVKCKWWLNKCYFNTFFL